MFRHKSVTATVNPGQRVKEPFNFYWKCSSVLRELVCALQQAPEVVPAGMRGGPVGGPK